jgi:hypothetical protein
MIEPMVDLDRRAVSCLPYLVGFGETWLKQ